MPDGSSLRIGFVPAHRGFFSKQLAAQARQAVIDQLGRLGIEVVVPSPEQTQLGCVGTIAEAEVCARLFRARDVRGILIGAVNFGDEQAAAWAVRQARLEVPILLWGAPETGPLRLGMDRRDAFCGLLSIAEALRQIGARYSITRQPISSPTERGFARDLQWFASVCQVVHGIRNARYGQIGARPEAFWTCRFDERQLQRLGPTTVVLDLSEVLAGADRIPGDDPDLSQLAADIRSYADASAVSAGSLEKMARLELFLKRWRQENAIDAFAIQCWTSIQQNFGVCACTTLSRLADQQTPAACEADILGTLSMHALQLAGSQPAALADWNNLHNDDPQLVNLWHCGVFPKSFARQQPRLSVHGILVSSGAASADQAQGIVELVARASPLTMTRVTQGDQGTWKALVAQGQIEDNDAQTAGSYGWCRVKNLEQLYRNVLLQHFPHHVAIAQSHLGNVLWEAYGNYLGMQVYHGEQVTPGLYTPALPF